MTLQQLKYVITVAETGTIGSSQQAVCFTAQFDQRDPRVGKGNEYCYFQPDQQGDHAFQRGR